MTKNGGKPMNGNNSTTETAVSERLSDSKLLAMQWKTIDWKSKDDHLQWIDCISGFITVFSLLTPSHK